MTEPARLEVNGRSYTLPQEPVVVVCIDGSEPNYHRRAIAAGRMSFLESVLRTGTDLSADCALPSLTNPNNISIATGVPPAIHGICANTFFDPNEGAEIMMDDPSFLRAPTVFPAFENAGVDVAVVTAKDKLRRLLGHGLEASICFSAEKAHTATVAEHGITDVLELVGRPQPDVYSSDLSEFVMVAGLRLMETRRLRLMYLSLTDYIPHKFAPGTQEANDFYGMLDTYFAQLDALGAVLVITADHGMNDKCSANGTPHIVYLQEQLDAWLGVGRAHVVLPIADPYTRHHGSLGSFAFVLVDEANDRDVAGHLAEIPGIEEAVGREEASARFELPADRIGDIAVLATRDVVLGTVAGDHDLTQLDRPLRSHGGLAEQRVPLIVNRSLAPLPHGHRLRNFDAFWLALNLVGSTAPKSEPAVNDRRL